MDFVGLAYDSKQYFPNENPTRGKKNIFSLNRIICKVYLYTFVVRAHK